MDILDRPDHERNDHGQRLARLEALGERVVRPAAVDVDKQARFPGEALAALREERLLGVALPPELGGAGASLAELSELCVGLAQHCASTAMIMAMHQIQVACLLRHGLESEFFRGYLRELAERQYLIASVTSEVGIGGDMRSSIAAVHTSGERIDVTKNASTVSYGEHADALLLTARAGEDAPRNDQVLVLLQRGDYQLERAGAWDTLGMRGTCSPPCKVIASARREQVLPPRFGTIASATMVPFSHVLWASVWLGIARDAVARARSMVRAQARKAPGTVPPTAMRLSELSTDLQTLRAVLQGFIGEYAALLARPDGGSETLSSIGFAVKANQLKVGTSELAVRIVSQALCLCGIAGYRNDTPQSVGRHLRDVYSSLLMIGNDRIHATNATLLLVHKGE